MSNSSSVSGASSQMASSINSSNSQNIASSENEVLSSHTEYFDRGQETATLIFTDISLATSENFQAAADDYKKAYEFRLAELGLDPNVQWNAADTEKAANDPMLNLYQQKIAWAEKWASVSEGSGVLTATNANTAFREDLNIMEQFFRSFSLDVNQDSTARDKAKTKANEYSETFVNLQQYMQVLRQMMINSI